MTPLTQRLQTEAMQHGLSGDKAQAYVAGGLNRIKAHKRGNIQGIVMPPKITALPKAVKVQAATKTMKQVAPTGQKVELGNMLKTMKS